MKSIRSLLGGVAAALITGLIALGALTLSVSEGNPWLAAATPTAPVPTPGLAGETLIVPTAVLPTTGAAASTATDWPLQIQPTTLTICLPPQGWIQYTVQPGDTLTSLAARHQISVETLRGANCLFIDNLLPYTYIYLPPGQVSPPTATATPIPCGAPAGWIQITLSTGDTLYSLSREYNISIYELQLANCMGYSTRLYAGSKFWVPNIPTRTPTATEALPPTATTQPPQPTLTFTPPVVGGVSLAPLADARAGDPGTTLTYSLTLTNTGTFSDTYIITASGGTWTSTVAPNLVGPLGGGGTQALTVSVTIPVDAPGGSTDTLTITATSQTNGTISATTVLTTTANTLASYGLSLTPATAAQSGTPGAAVLYTLTLTNTGSVPDTFNLNLSGAVWDTTAPGTVGPLNSGASQEITITVNIPSDSENGTSDTATVTAVSQGDSTVTASAVLTTTVVVKMGGTFPGKASRVGTIPATRASHNTATRPAL